MELRGIREELSEAREDRKTFAAHMQEMERTKFLAEDYEEHRERFHRGANLAAANEKTLTDHEKMLAGVRNAALVGSKPEEDVPASVLRRHGFKIMMVGLMLYASGSITFNVDWDKVNALLAASAKTPAAAATPNKKTRPPLGRPGSRESTGRRCPGRHPFLLSTGFSCRPRP